MFTEVTSESDQVTKEKLIQDFKVVVSDAEELLKATASQAGDKISAARERVTESLATAKRKLADAEAVVVDTTKAAAKVTDQFVHENPWKAVGIAAAAGFLLGLLVNRR